MLCNSGRHTVDHRVNSNPEHNKDADPCAVALTVEPSAIAYGHSHPYFTDYRAF